VRLRLLIPAALAAAATYAALVRDEATPAPSWTSASSVPPSAPVPVPEEPTPVALEPPAVIISIVPVLDPPEPAAEPEVDPIPWSASPYADLADATLSPAEASVYDMLAGTPPEPASAEVEAEAPAEAPVERSDARIPALDEGRFALGGWAAAPGHSVVAAITFRRRLAGDVSTGQIVLEIDASDNVPDDGLVVMSNPGFAPDREGFTLFLAAAEAGAFSAAGSYRVLPA
jgi:hypothetical protein